MEKKAKSIFPKGFFSQQRPIVSSKEALKDVIPIKWNNDIVNKSKKNIVNSTKTRKI